MQLISGWLKPKQIGSTSLFLLFTWSQYMLGIPASFTALIHYCNRKLLTLIYVISRGSFISWTYLFSLASYSIETGKLKHLHSQAEQRNKTKHRTLHLPSSLKEEKRNKKSFEMLREIIFSFSRSIKKQHLHTKNILLWSTG